MAELDMVTEAKNAFDHAEGLRQQADARVAELKVQEESLSAYLDDLQQQYEAKAAELRGIREEIQQQTDAGDALSDAMDGFDKVLQVHGVPRQATP